MRVLRVSELAAIGGEIKLIPPGELGFGRKRLFVGCRVADQITADGDDGFAAFGPEYSHDVGGARSPIEASDDCFLNFESVHQRDDVDSDDGLLAVADGAVGEKTCGAVAAQVGNDHAVALCC